MSMIAAALLAATAASGLPPGLLSAVCWVESHHEPKAVHQDDGGSPSSGLCQLKTSTAVSLGFKGTPKQLLTRPDLNAKYAAMYLRRQLDRYHGHIPSAIAAYNAGKARLNAKGQIMNRKYVNKVMQAWEEGR